MILNNVSLLFNIDSVWSCCNMLWHGSISSWNFIKEICLQFPFLLISLSKISYTAFIEKIEHVCSFYHLKQNCGRMWLCLSWISVDSLCKRATSRILLFRDFSEKFNFNGYKVSYFFLLSGIRIDKLSILKNL